MLLFLQTSHHMICFTQTFTTLNVSILRLTPLNAPSIIVTKTYHSTGKIGPGSLATVYHNISLLLDPIFLSSTSISNTLNVGCWFRETATPLALSGKTELPKNKVETVCS